ncbi:hypothetical protein BCR43DRAFT_32014 [Syncephalastrum racemosum]|uniref:LisH domain-containing protein n=1 Tax=Syncephalastrum racemosum TaxID=13706 RepID=A0A1X2HTT2_SYNRA|nr:hypothetical protein BCR43DRAFT_32014 [Syncephalastrum racemosum]
MPPKSKVEKIPELDALVYKYLVAQGHRDVANVLKRKIQNVEAQGDLVQVYKKSKSEYGFLYC